MAEPLAHAKDAVRLTDSSITVHAAPHCMLFLTATWSGRQQTIPLDPSDAEAFIASLRSALAFQAARSVGDEGETPE